MQALSLNPERMFILNFENSKEINEKHMFHFDSVFIKSSKVLLLQAAVDTGVCEWVILNDLLTVFRICCCCKENLLLGQWGKMGQWDEASWNSGRKY